MRVTIEIPDPLYRKAKIRAAQRGETLKHFFLSALQRELAEVDQSPANDSALDRSDLYELNTQGFAVLKREPGGSIIVTNAWVTMMRDETGL